MKKWKTRKKKRTENKGKNTENYVKIWGKRVEKVKGRKDSKIEERGNNILLK